MKIETIKILVESSRDGPNSLDNAAGAVFRE